MNAALGWDEGSSELRIREVAVRGAEMGSASLKGVIGNVSKDVFNTDTAVATVALLGASARSLDIAVENKGLFEKLAAEAARKQRKTPEAVRREYAAAAAIAVPALLGNSGQAKQIGQTIASFLARPGRLSIAARTRDPAGLGVADLATLGEPAAVLEKLEVTATTE
jgi:hypothetical protein